MRSGLLDGLICVDMLGEGFDFPNLKIAAIHEPHKSLASTLQFVGRFARTNASDIGKASFIAMNDESLRIENQVLYSSDSIWQDMILSLSEGKINSESEHIDKINQFTLEENPEDFEISLHNIRLNAHAKIYKVDSFNLEGVLPEECMVDGAIYKDSSSMTVVAIAQNISVPLWSVGDQLIDIENTLYILHFQKCTSLLFIYSQNKSEKLYDLIAKSFAVNPEKIPRNEMNRVLGKLSNYEFFNTGMQNRYIELGESYRIYSGSNTASSIDKVTGKMRSAGHAFCKADGVEGSVTIGYSSGSKIWSSAYVSIPDYIRWCDFNGNKIVNSNLIVKTNTNYDYLPLPHRLIEYSESIVFCLFSDKTYSKPPILLYDTDEQGEYLVTDLNLSIYDKTAKTQIGIRVELNGIVEMLYCDLNARYTSSSTVFRIKNGRDSISLADYFGSIINPVGFSQPQGF